MEKCLVWELSDGIDGDFSLLGVTLTVAVSMRECFALNVQCGKRVVCVPNRHRWQLHCLAVSLRQHKPARFINEGCKTRFLFLACLVFLLALHSYRHTERERLF